MNALLKAPAAGIFALFAFSCGASSQAPPAPVSPTSEPDAPAEASAASEPASAEAGAANEAASAEPSAASEPSAAELAQTPTEIESAKSSPASQPRLSLPQGGKVLLVGDSFAGALAPALRERLEKDGLSVAIKFKDASYLTDWAWGKEQVRLLTSSDADLVIITLGANELAIDQPERRISTLRKLEENLQGKACLWVAIPFWDGPQNGLMSIISENLQQCAFWDSNQLLDAQRMTRVQDGIHPTKSAKEYWAEELYLWLRAQSERSQD